MRWTALSICALLVVGAVFVPGVLPGAADEEERAIPAELNALRTA
jgi:hypothetical protein